MANITVNEVSQNYTYNIGNNAYATVAMPIAACWGPGYFDYDATAPAGTSSKLDDVAWRHYPATQAGMEAFVADYRGPESFYKTAKDFSYYQALTYLSSGYDVLVCRVGAGTEASLAYKSKTTTTGESPTTTYSDAFTLRAKYPGSFGNQLFVEFTPKTRYDANSETNVTYWSGVVYAISESGYRNAVENILLTFNAEQATDSIPFVDDVESAFVDFQVTNYTNCSTATELVGRTSGADPKDATQFESGSDTPPTPGSGTPAAPTAQAVATARFQKAKLAVDTGTGLGSSYPAAVNTAYSATSTSAVAKSAILAREYHFTMAADVITLLRDKLAYNPDFLVLPGWDDIDFAYLENIDPAHTTTVSFTTPAPLHVILLDTAYYSRCATAYIDIPRCATKAQVWNNSTDKPGYAQILSRYRSEVVPLSDANSALYNTHSCLCLPWGQFTYVGTGKHNIANPAFESLMIERAMILNQAAQYKWALPNNRTHNLRLGKLDYNVSKKYLDQWQSLEGVGVNIITNIPGMGISLWGNSTLYEVPPATYQALANLSTRKLFNAIEDLVYRVGISITFAYNNDQAYSKFYAGVTPLLDTMKNVGAIDGYYVRMAADVDGLDQVNANTVVGKIYLIVNGVINDIVVDLIALPPGSDLTQYQ